MKRIITLFAVILITASVFAQAPNKMSYQAVIRNSSNALVTNSAVGIRISILQTSATGTAVYVETQNPTTNANGLVSVDIGGGTVVSGNFANINWANGPYFIKTETDPTGGSNYTIIGTSQLLSVPYAMYAAASGSNTPGPAGPQGPAGNDGAPGPQGPAGATGPQGPTGQTGATGQQGPAGATGPQGATGLTGAQGPQGPQGATGPAGTNGTNGADGKTVLNGTTNPSAIIGNNGDFYINTTTNTIFGPKALGAWPTNGVSLVGPQGPAGATGAQGATGPQGPIGLTGPAGPQGPIGLTGAPGQQGPAGSGGFNHFIGEFFGGGVVFHVWKDPSGIEHGLVISTVNQNTSLTWSNVTSTSVGISANSSWNGLANSNAIVAQSNHSSSAASLCLNYTYIPTGENDWYLPSIDELQLIFNNRFNINQTLNSISNSDLLPLSANFWSSTEQPNSASQAWSLIFTDGTVTPVNKTSPRFVRAIRSY